MTFFLKKKETQRAAPDEALKGADFSLDFSKGVGYLTDQQLQEKWGDAYEDNLKRIKEICQEAQSLVLRDSDDALITAATTLFQAESLKPPPTYFPRLVNIW